jgi:hypothetical protein
MKSQSQMISNNIIYKLIGLGLLGFQGVLFAFSQSVTLDKEAEARKAQAANIEIRSEVEHIGAAEVRSATLSSGFYPALQPEIYWHDADWNIDLIPPSTSNDVLSLSIRSGSGRAQIVKLDDDYAQIDSISRTLNNKAIVIGDINGMTKTFSIVDLKLGNVIAKRLMYGPSVSPDQRFILYNNWYLPHSESAENQYTLYDTLKTPAENICSYWDSNPKHKGRNDEGILVFPQVTICPDGGDGNDDNMATNFTWAPDSSKVVFADAKGGEMSLVVVTMPVGAKDLPRTSVYALTGAEDVCEGATDAAGEKNCDYHIIQSLSWEGDAVKTVFHHRFGTNFDLEKTIPVSKFVFLNK